MLTLLSFVIELCTFFTTSDGCYVRSDIGLPLGKLTILYSIQKTSWADDVEDLGEHFGPLFLRLLTFVQTNPKAKIISMTMVFGRQ